MKPAAGLLLMLASLGAIAQDLPAPHNFDHIILIVQENRTPDNLFHGLSGLVGSNGVAYDIQNYGLASDDPGVHIPLLPSGLGEGYDLSHNHPAFVAAFSANQNDGSWQVPFRCGKTFALGAGCVAANQSPVDTYPQYKYVENTAFVYKKKNYNLLDPYLDLATQYGWANFMFQTNQGPSYPAHLFLFGGTSAPSADDDAAKTFISENPSGGADSFNDVGCSAVDVNGQLFDVEAQLITPNGEEKGNRSPTCFDHDNMADLLDSNQITWRYYTPTTGFEGANKAGSIWTAPNAFSSICTPEKDENGQYQCTGKDWSPGANGFIDLTPPDVFADINGTGPSGCNLAAVSWVIPAGQYSDHAAINFAEGPSWVGDIVNAVGKSPCGYWQNTAIVITWDDWGGWYDHEVPPSAPDQYSDYAYGFRVPLIFVSAYTPNGYVSNTKYFDFGTILRFVEHNFGLTEGALHFADAIAKGNLSQFYKFTRSPRKFKSIVTPLDASFFVENAMAPEPPDDD